MEPVNRIIRDVEANKLKSRLLKDLPNKVFEIIIKKITDEEINKIWSNFKSDRKNEIMNNIKNEAFKDHFQMIQKGLNSIIKSNFNDKEYVKQIYETFREQILSSFSYYNNQYITQKKVNRDDKIEIKTQYFDTEEFEQFIKLFSEKKHKYVHFIQNGHVSIENLVKELLNKMDEILKDVNYHNLIVELLFDVIYFPQIKKIEKKIKNNENFNQIDLKKILFEIYFKFEIVKYSDDKFIISDDKLKEFLQLFKERNGMYDKLYQDHLKLKGEKVSIETRLNNHNKVKDSLTHEENYKEYKFKFKIYLLFIILSILSFYMAVTEFMKKDENGIRSGDNKIIFGSLILTIILFIVPFYISNLILKLK